MLIWYGATAVVAGVAATLIAQSDSPKDSSSNSNYIETSKLVGRKVKSSQGKEIGVIKDLVLDGANGCMAYTVVSTGGEGTGVTSGGGKMVAVPWAIYSRTSDLSALTVKVNRDKIYNAPAFEYGRIDEYARPDYINNIYSYYDVSPGAGTAGVSGKATAGTDVTGTAGATASPGEVASPGPIATVVPNTKPPAAAPAGSAANPETGPSANDSRKGLRSARAIGTPSPTGRAEAGSSITTEQSAAESTTGPSEKRRSRSEAIEETATYRPSATPEASDGED